MRKLCCLRSSANVSYLNAAKDIKYYTGINISEKTQERIVHRHKFDLEESRETIK